MMKLYLKTGDKLTHYHEAWQDGKSLIEHWGELGTRGETATHKLKPRISADRQIRELLATAKAKGYAEIEEDDHAILLIEYAIDGMGTTADLDKRHALEAWLNEELGWTGLGHCDGGSIGSGTMEACCFVVDFDLTKRVLTESLRATEFADFTRIYREDE